jgi:hypothetical protein
VAPSWQVLLIAIHKLQESCLQIGTAQRCHFNDTLSCVVQNIRFIDPETQ